MQACEILALGSWRGYQRHTFPAGSWLCEGDMLRTVAEAERIDLITQQQYRNFDLELEWRVVSGGNSGILYRVTETQPHAWQSGLEMQLLDDAHHPDGRTPETSAGALYGLMAPWQKVVRPAGCFNTTRIVVHDTQVEHWLNEELVLAYDGNSATFTTTVAYSKFKDLPGFARARCGHIALQHHSATVWFRHLRIRPLP
jgi:3-keto-disaccharide hydrolase